MASDWKHIKKIWEDFSLSEYVQYDKTHITDNADADRKEIVFDEQYSDKI